MDNLQVHKSLRVRELIEQAGASIMLLPPYSPDFSPIEQAFSKVKNILRKVQARTHEVLVEAIGRALDAVSRRDALGWFEHCGYYVLEIWRKSFVDLERQVGLLENLAGWAYCIMQRVIVEFRKNVGQEILLIARKRPECE